MQITWYGNASIKIESGNAAFLIDPFVPMAPSTVPVTAGDYFGVNDILVTHGHFDHIIDIPKLCENEEAKVYTTQTPANTLTAAGVKKKQIRLIDKDKTFSIGDISISCLKGKHVRMDYRLALCGKRFKNIFSYFSEAVNILKLNQNYRENGEILSFLINAEGRSVLVLGSLGICEEEDYPTGVDLLILPYQGALRLLETASDIIDRIRPKTVLLDHYDDTFPPITINENTEEIKSAYQGKTTILTIPYKIPITL